ncbi:MAG: hypothetical protein P4L81_04170 [Candidatus Pacebacteria bacterium]|nr:hypothetical protein [Candidatus Paceibacterota bacterium]
MMDTVRRLVWFAIVATAAFFAIFVVLGNFALLQAQNPGVLAIHDIVTPGTHSLSGILVLPLSCDELSVATQKVSDTEYLLAFQSWQDPSIDCPKAPAPRAFQAVALAPATGVQFVATLDGKPLPITIITDVAASSSSL